MKLERHALTRANDACCDQRLRDHCRPGQSVVLDPRREAGALPKADARCCVTTNDVIGVAEPPVGVLGMPERRSETRPDVTALVVGAACVQLDDQLRDQVGLRDVHGHHSLL